MIITLKAIILHTFGGPGKENYGNQLRPPFNKNGARAVSAQDILIRVVVIRGSQAAFDFGDTGAVA